MSYFGNDAVNRVTAHAGLQAFAQGAGGVFFFVVLIQAGVPGPLALLAQAAIQAGRFVLRPLVLPLAVRFGLKPLLVAGAVALAAQYPALAAVLYWVSYNAYFSAVGDVAHRGRQVGAREALVASAGVVAPLLGAWAIVQAGPAWAFAGVALVQASSTLPLLGAPNVRVARVAEPAPGAARLGMALSAADALFDVSFFFVWQIALFQALGQSIAAYGGAMALAGLAGAAGAFLLGAHVDQGRGRRAVGIGYGVAALVLFARAGSLETPWLAIAANAAGAFVMPLLVPSLVTANANLAKSTPCPLRFHMAQEAGWDIAGFGACVAAAALVWGGASPTWALLIGAPGLAWSVVLLWAYFAPRRQ